MRSAARRADDNLVGVGGAGAGVGAGRHCAVVLGTDRGPAVTVGA